MKGESPKQQASGSDGASNAGNQQAAEALKKIEWMLSGQPSPGDASQTEHRTQNYGDLTVLNHDGMILKSIGRERLESFANDYLELLGTSSAIYEVNGDYAFGIFTSGWCRMMDCASRRLCETSDNAEALNSGRWLCHESCWAECSRRAIAESGPVDIACNGGLRIYAIPILAHDKVVGAINFGYGDPPTDPEQVQALATTYQLDVDDLVREAEAYDSRPPFVIELARKRLHATARLIGAMIETKQAQEAQRESARRFRGMLDVVPDMISIHSPDMEILYSNWQGFAAVPENRRIFNTKCYKAYRDFDDICPDCLAKTVLKTGKPMREEAKLPDGTWVDLRVIPLLDSNNQVEMFMEWVRDITEQKRNEEALRLNQESLRTTLQSIGDAVISTDVNGLVADMNPVAESLTGWTRGKAIGQRLEKVFRIINEETGNKVKSPVTNVLENGTIVGLANHTLLIARDGREIPIADSGAPIRNDAGAITGVVLVFRDQTEERAARKALEESAEILDTTGQMARIGGWELYPETMKVTWTKETYRIHEVPENVKPPLEDAINFWHPEDQPVLRKAIQEALEKGAPYDLELRFITAKGRHLFARTKCNPVMQDGKVVKLQGFFQDITQRKQAEEALNVTQHNLLVAQRIAHIGNWHWDIENNIVWWSDELYSIYGLNPGEYTPSLNSSIEKMHPDDRERVKQAVDDALKNRKPYDIEMRVIRPDGIVRVINARGEVICDNAGNPQSMAGTVQDITDRKQVEEQIRFQADIIDNAPIIAAYHDSDLNMVWANNAYQEATGLSLAEIKGRKCYSVWNLPKPCRGCPVLTAIETGKKASYELTPDNQDDWPETQGCWLSEATPVKDERGAVIGAIEFASNITSRKQSEAEQRKLEAQLVQAQKMESIGRLAGGVAHDFNNMIMGVMNYAELCRDRLDADHPIQEWLDEITHEMERSATLTRQLLAFARKQTIAPKVLDLNDTVGDMLKMLRRLIGEDIDLAWEPGAGLWPVKLDPGQLDQILANLCVNARDAIGGGGKVTIETEDARIDDAYCAEHVEARPGEFVMLAVSDDGCGMDRETLGNIFEPFFTTKPTGEGTTFRIYLPRVEGASASAPTGHRPGSASGGEETILLVEDEASIRETVGILLQRLGYTVLSAEDPSAALQRVADHQGPIHLLITDVIMPGMSGRELAERLIGNDPAMKVLYMSGYTANVIAHLGILEEGVHFVSKPISGDDLAHKVREVLSTDNAGRREKGVEAS